MGQKNVKNGFRKPLKKQCHVCGTKSACVAHPKSCKARFWVVLCHALYLALRVIRPLCGRRIPCKNP